METVERYLVRKTDEIQLLNSFLEDPPAIRCPTSVAEVIEQKFHLAAALKAQHALHDWAATETAWSHSRRPNSGPFEFKYDYQRADLTVRGPSFYPFHERADVVYAASGMAAISALLMAIVHVLTEADVATMPNSYGETLELIDDHMKHLRRIEFRHSMAEVASQYRSRTRILLLDSCTSTEAFDATLKCVRPSADLVIFDTTCFCSSSIRIRSALHWARREKIPMILVRSHTKLDSLGVEYGRLGSAVFMDCSSYAGSAQQKCMRDLSMKMRDAVRLFGSAALPAHFPPYVGTPSYHALTVKRAAAMLRNTRRAARHFESQVGLSAKLDFVHGLYIALASRLPLDEEEAREIAAELSDDLGRKGLPLRHAGSFGFDFAAVEWSQDRQRNQYVVRLAAADLPTSLWDEIVKATGAWWVAKAHKIKRRPRVGTQ